MRRRIPVCNFILLVEISVWRNRVEFVLGKRVVCNSSGGFGSVRLDSYIGLRSRRLQGGGMRLLLILISLLSIEVHAVDHCVAASGTATSGGCAGPECTQSEWESADVCYPATASGITDALVAAAADGGSTVTLDDGGTSVRNRIVTRPMPPSGGTVTVRCRTPVPGACWVTSSNGDRSIWELDDSDANDFEFKNVGCRRTAAVTNATFAAGCINAKGEGTGNVTLDGVHIRNMHFDLPGVTSSCCAVINMGAQLDNKTLTIRGESIIDSISYQAAAVDTGLIRLLGSQDLNIQRLNVSGFSTVGVRRAIDCNDVCVIENLNATWHASEGSVPDIINAFIFSDEERSILNIANSTFSHAHISGASPHAGFVYTRGTTYLKDVICSNNDIAAYVVEDPSSACIFGSGEGAKVTAVDLLVVANRAQYGGGFYLSQGASGVFVRPVVINNTIMSGILGYCGGWGDCTIVSATAFGNIQAPGGENDDGALWYCQLHSTARRNRSCSMYSSFIRDNEVLASAPSSILFRNNSGLSYGCDGDACDHLMNIYGSSIRNGKNQEIQTEFYGGGSYNVLGVSRSSLTDPVLPVFEEANWGDLSKSMIELAD